MKDVTDPVVMLPLLWGSRTKAGRSGLTLQGLVDAAMTMADRDGLINLSMRRLASTLDVGSMSIYSYVPGRAELIELMIDTAVSDLYSDMDEPAGRAGTWQERLVFVAQRNWQLLLDHRWLLDVMDGRPVLGPNVVRKYEIELRALEGVGFTDVAMDALLTTTLGHVGAMARNAVAAEQVTAGSGQTDSEWWHEAGRLLPTYFDETRFPVAARVGASAGEQYQAAADPAHALQFGLDVIVRGAEQLLELNLN